MYVNTIPTLFSVAGRKEGVYPPPPSFYFSLLGMQLENSYGVMYILLLTRTLNLPTPSRIPGSAPVLYWPIARRQAARHRSMRTQWRMGGGALGGLTPLPRLFFFALLVSIMKISADLDPNPPPLEELWPRTPPPRRIPRSAPAYTRINLEYIGLQAHIHV